MNTTQKFSCFLIGEGSLLIQCAEILVNHGHAIHGLVSSDQKVHQWAQEYNISYIDPKTTDLVTFISRQPFDYLFSIVNPFILSKQVLELPRLGAINYHDAPLPKYAGNYATSWAIMQGERKHGITWHEMIALVDAGRIFKQRFFEIDEHETVFSLNTKCYDAAISSFSELIEDIDGGTLSVKQQDLNERTFYPRYKRPSPGGVLRWSRTAREICALVRALNFGPYDNPLCLPKLAVGVDFVLVLKIEETDLLSADPPGTITHIDSGSVRVATGDGEVLLSKLLTIDGQPLPISDFIETFGLYEGYRFRELDQEVADRITTYNALVCQHEAFWTKYLKTVEKVSLPYAQRNTPLVPAEQHAHASMPIPQEVITSLKAYHEGWSIEDYLLTAFVTYLARLGDIWSFDLGYRDVELKLELAGLEGLFWAYGFLHVNMESNQNFEEIFHNVSGQVQLTKKRKTYARDIVARFSNLSWEAKLRGAYQPSILVERVEALDRYQLPQGIELALGILEGGQECLWAYNPEILSAASIEKMQHEFITFLQGSVTNFHKSVAHLPLLTEHERHQLLEEWNATQADYPQQQCVHELFEAQVQRTPDAVAVSFEATHLTYQELNQRANQLAHHLQLHGVGPDVLVGLCVERSLEMIVGMLGVLKAGGAYVPLDPSSPPERFAFVLQDSQMPLLLTQQALLDRLPTVHPQIVCLDADWQAISRQSDANPKSRGTNQHLAYVIYTSGSTGQPKGVLIEHRSLTAHCWSIIQKWKLSVADHVLQFSTFTFDASVEQIFPTLAAGARLVLRGEEVWSPTELLRQIKARQLTVLTLPTTYWQQTLQEWVDHPRQLVDLPLRLVIVGGERLQAEVVHLWGRTPLRSVRLLNSYGPTEATIATTMHEIAYEQEQTSEPIPIGRPLTNRSVYILDKTGNPVPIGVAGELHIGGVGIARGYLNRPALTAERFIPDPFSKEPQARLYRTGDMARYRADGNIEFLGRADDQVKIRGYRIELGEIEAVLSRHPAIRQSVVITREDIPGDTYLVAYLTIAPESLSLPKVSELRQFLAKQLPTYMLPSAFVFLEAFPLTSSGKVDRRALMTRPLERPEQNENYVAPETPSEEIVARVWIQVLGIKRISIHDNFFDLGGHSLLATQIITRLHNIFQLELSLSTLFASPTIAELALVIEKMLIDEIEELDEEEAERLMER